MIVCHALWLACLLALILPGASNFPQKPRTYTYICLTPHSSSGRCVCEFVELPAYVLYMYVCMCG